MTKTNNDTFPYNSLHVPAQVFGDAAEGIMFELTDLIMEISLAADYSGKDAIIHAIKLTDGANRLQSYLFAHLDELIHQKKMKDYEQKANKD